MRSYPECVPVRTPSTNATGGCGGDVVFVTNAMNELQEKAGKFESGGVWFAVGVALGLGLGKPPGTPLVRWRLKFDTTNTPITIAAISAAARPAIQNGPGRAGACSLSADRTRADSAGLGDPDIASKARLRSRRKLLRLVSEHLLGGEAGCT